uniref:Rho-GAP domain-containing protein n=1 Tax=Pectinophora gossypiella TaxID=13191 RepID=A0A1E1WQG0_PECGO
MEIGYAIIYSWSSIDDGSNMQSKWKQSRENIYKSIEDLAKIGRSKKDTAKNGEVQNSKFQIRSKIKRFWNTNTGGSSNEDLSDSTEVSIPKSHVKRRLRNFFAKRPTMDSLVKKGIYQEEPVFGRKLEEVCPAASPRVPEFVVACVREIESNEENMCTDGLYRASGNLSQVQKIRLEVDQNNLSVIENSTDIHVLTGSLKLFFRELKEPLIPCSMFDRVLAACSIKPRESKIKEFRDIVHSLPQCNRETLKFLLEHLLRVTQFSERNRMHTANLAIVFGPTLLWAPAEQAHNIAIDCIQQNHVVEILLNEFKDIFEDNKAKKKT